MNDVTRYRARHYRHCGDRVGKDCGVCAAYLAGAAQHRRQPHPLCPRAGTNQVTLLQSFASGPSHTSYIRELAFGIRDAFDALGAGIGLKTGLHVVIAISSHCHHDAAVITGGLDMVTQAITLSKKPHIIIGQCHACILAPISIVAASPGRILDHLENTKGFNLKTLKFLVRDNKRPFILYISATLGHG